MPRDLELRLESDALTAADLHIYEVTGHEHISRPFEYEIYALCTDPLAVDEDEVMATPAALVYLKDGVEVHRVAGMIAAIDDRMRDEMRYPGFVFRPAAPTSW